MQLDGTNQKTSNCRLPAADCEQQSRPLPPVKAAGLVETLEGKGPFTVFAPTNAAFDKLPAGTVDMLSNGVIHVIDTVVMAK